MDRDKYKKFICQIIFEIVYGDIWKFFFEIVVLENIKCQAQSFILTRGLAERKHVSRYSRGALRFYAFFWVIPRRLNFICRRFGTLYLFHLQRKMKMEQTECSETWAYKIQTLGESPTRKHTTFRTRRKFEIKNTLRLSEVPVNLISFSCFF